MLAAALSQDEGAVRADLQRVYHIDLDQAMAGAHSAGHVAALIAHLPSNSETRKAFDRDAVWTLEASLLAAILNDLNMYLYAQSDKRRRGTPPKKVGPSWMTGEGGRKLEARVMTIDQLQKQLAKARRGHGK